jgi:hypothetical protein
VRKFAPRFGVSVLMLVVALSAVLIFFGMKVSELRAIGTRYRGRANAHSVHRRTEEMLLKDRDAMSNTAIKVWVEDTLRYHSDLEKKYTKAATRPWVAIEPDPPEPPVPTVEQLLKGSPVIESGVPTDFVPRTRSSKLRSRRPSSGFPRTLRELE